CHVEGAPARGVTATQQQQWRAEEQWVVRWHGTDDGGRQCAACHAQAERGGRTVFGPEMRTVTRPDADAVAYAAERARYAAPPRRHEPEFAAHAQGRECTQCHLGNA